MAKTPLKQITLTLLLITLIVFSFSISLTTADDYSFSRDLSAEELGHKKQKLTHLHFYFHDVVSGPNATALRVAQAATTNVSAVSFGYVAVLDDPLTVGPEPTSKKIGSAQGMYISTSQSDLQLQLVVSYVFTEGIYNGSTLSILGHNAILTPLRELPIVGGTGVFKFATGYAHLTTYMFNLTSLDAIVEYNVYVLHY
ncbi:dirigent protein 21-like [Humulus lupulus]|uniref:dirigent protein 21-like n=1 Tax=Humulus lupulus TaxID=3486 RepID=UPI002B41846F|nr:dirigent protein 21-like [Humulus lupulus]